MGKQVLLFVTVLACLIGLLLITACIPKAAFRDRLLASAVYLENEESTFYQIIPGDRRTELHNYADAITLNILYSIDGENRWKEILMAPFYSDQGNQEYPMLRLLRERIESELPADTIYDRYWHGMMVILRPLFVFMNIRQIRLLALAVLLILLADLSFSLWRKGQRALSAFLWAAALAVELPMAAFCMEYLPTWLIMLAVSLFAVKWRSSRERVAGLAIVSGVCCAFFDFLTTETVAFVIPMAVVLCLWEREGRLKSFRQELFFLIRCGVSWVLSYGGTLMVKWMLASLATGQERFSDALQMVMLRQGASAGSVALDSLQDGKIVVENVSAAVTGLPQTVAAFLVNIRLLLGLSGKVSLEGIGAGLLLLIGVLGAVLYIYHGKGTRCVLGGLLLLLGLIPIIRMLVLHNHSLEHCFFVYRSLYATLVCTGMGMINIIDWKMVKSALRMARLNCHFYRCGGKK